VNEPVRGRLAAILWAFLEGWGIPLLVGLPLAAVILWLEDAGVWLYLGLGAALVGVAGFYVSIGIRRTGRAAVTLGFTALAFTWPPTFYLVAEHHVPPGWLGEVVRVVAVSPALAGLGTLAAGWRAAHVRPWRRGAGYALMALGLLALVPTAWMADPWRWVAGGAGLLTLIAGSRLAPPLAYTASAAVGVEMNVRIDAWGVRRSLSGGREESVAWAALTRVAIHTSGDGPLAEDLWWVLGGADGGVLVPGSDPSAEALLKRLGRLPGFDHAAVIEAMSSVDDATFVCWSGEAGQGVDRAEEPGD
jgi:hypothetical protein